MDKYVKIYEVLTRTFGSRELNNDYSDEVENIINNSTNNSLPFSLEGLQSYRNDPYQIEKDIISYIIKIQKLDKNIKYLSLNLKKMNVQTKEEFIIFDELLEFSLMQFYIIIFSLSYNKSEENMEKCIKNCISLLDLQGVKKEVGMRSEEKPLDTIMQLPKNIIDIIFDSYWISWTFIIVHEIFHLRNFNNVASQYDEELMADKFAYTTLINIILEQKEGKVPSDISVYYEHLYLVPMMIMEYFKLIDYYKILIGKSIYQNDYPTFEIRQQQLFDLFDDVIPESFNTDEGNALFGNFLDAIDFLKEQLILKKENGKLDMLL